MSDELILNVQQAISTINPPINKDDDPAIGK
ncbi:hypothetical protein SAMN05192552_102833 [Natrinema hispanicum]|uniref:Uncharacterized protein n=1 Tax=Natrinema hispanicum TaxID=392421 RepID=A0A1G6VHL2_9EURY|nr:hypothetical protein SAMN05192552_102833 [Natrinema hispanicum]